MNTARRTLLWAAPAVTIAAAAPAYATSPPAASCVIAAQRIRQPGKSKGRPWVYLVTVHCTTRFDFVIVNNRVATKPRQGNVYTVTLPGCYDTLTVDVKTRGGVVSQVVRVE